MLYPQDARINVLAPIVRGRKGEFKKELAALRARGFTKARIDGQFRSLDEDIKLDRRRNHTIDVVVDRLIVRGGIERRLTESVDIALNLADDIVVINTLDGGDRLFSRRLACVDCGISMPEMTPRAFSFNSPHGACPECQGLGAIVRLRSAARRARRVEVARRRRDRAVGQAATSKLVREALATLAGDVRHRSRRCRSRSCRRSSATCCCSAPGAATRRRRREEAKARARSVRRGFEGLVPNLRRRYEEGTLGRAGGARAVSRAAPVPGLPRRAAEAAEPRGPRQGPDDRRVRRTCRSAEALRRVRRRSS